MPQSRSFISPAQQRVELFGTVRSNRPDVAEFLSANNARVVLEAARAINDAGISHAYPDLALLLFDPRFTDSHWGRDALSNVTPAGPFSANARLPRDQVLLRALNAHFRLGTKTNAEALASFAGDAARPPHLRAEALFLLGSWEVLPAKVGDLPIKPTKDANHGAVPTVNPENWPGWFDRVVGLWRPLPARSADGARVVLDSQVAALLKEPSVPIATAALEAAMKLKLTSADAALLQLLKNTNTATGLRRRIPEALATLNSPRLGSAVEVALADTDPAVRASALPYLAKLDGARATDVLGRIVAAPARTEAEVRLVQAAFNALGQMQGAAAAEVIAANLRRMNASDFSRSVHLELLDAASRRTELTIQALLAARTNAFSSPLSAWQPVLQGGDVARGKAVFFEKAETQCSRCHKVKNDGGIVGPALDGIGKRQTREQLLEAIILPNQRIAAGFENALITLKDGRDVAGLVKSETATIVRIESPEDGPLTIRKSEIASRRAGLSAMPEGLGTVLSAREMRDLVEYLASLR